MEISEKTPIEAIAAHYGTTPEIIKSVIDQAQDCWKGIEHYYSITYSDDSEHFDVSLGCKDNRTGPQTVWDLVMAILEHIDNADEWSDYPKHMCGTGGIGVHCRLITEVK
ncbi:MAG: hypothetical protein HQL87_00905 [Magnetococcales bacterium]|nr:hypothetical protein [Magnetococcales bacterium]